jgi:hypothetical protein
MAGRAARRNRLICAAPATLARTCRVATLIAVDIRLNEALVNVGTSHDTADFAIHSIRQWWNLLGKYHYDRPKRWLICADSGGSNGYRNRATASSAKSPTGLRSGRRGARHGKACMSRRRLYQTAATLAVVMLREP